MIFWQKVNFEITAENLSNEKMTKADTEMETSR